MCSLWSFLLFVTRKIRWLFHIACVCFSVPISLSALYAFNYDYQFSVHHVFTCLLSFLCCCRSHCRLGAKKQSQDQVFARSAVMTSSTQIFWMQNAIQLPVWLFGEKEQKKNWIAKRRFHSFSLPCVLLCLPHRISLFFAAFLSTMIILVVVIVMTMTIIMCHIKLKLNRI